MGDSQQKPSLVVYTESDSRSGRRSSNALSSILGLICFFFIALTFSYLIGEGLVCVNDLFGLYDLME